MNAIDELYILAPELIMNCDDVLRDGVRVGQPELALFMPTLQVDCAELVAEN